MREFYDKIFNLNERHLFISILLSFFIISLYHLHHGYYMSPDSGKFSRLADDLIQSNLKIFNFSERVPAFFISIPISLIALFKIIFVDKWQYAFLVFNLSLLLFSLIFFAKILLLVGVRHFLFFNFAINYNFSRYLNLAQIYISDMCYSFLVFVIIYFIAKGFVKNNFNYFFILSILFLILITRPSSVSVIFAVVFFIIIYNYDFILKPKIFLSLLFILFFSVPFVFGIFYYFIESNFNDNMQLQWWLLSKVKLGMIIHDRPETWVDSPKVFIDVVYIYFLRLINFFNPYASAFSLIHNLLNIFQMFMIISSILIWVFLGEQISKKNKMFCFILVMSFIVASFHSFTLIDYDWRYRFPIILPLLMLVSISIEIIMQKKKMIR